MRFLWLSRSRGWDIPRHLTFLWSETTLLVKGNVFDSAIQDNYELFVSLKKTKRGEFMSLPL